MPRKLAKFCHLLLLFAGNKPFSDSFLVELAPLVGGNWKAKKIAELRNELIEWQQENEELVVIKTKDHSKFGYASTKQLNRLVDKRVKELSEK